MKPFLKFFLIFLLLLAYILLELNFNIVLVALYSQPLAEVFGQYQHLASDVELAGRMLTSFGLALSLITLIPRRFFACQKVTNPNLKTTSSWTLRVFVFAILWALLVPSLRLVVDASVHQSSNQDKLNAIRAVLFKEALNRNMIEFDGSKALSDVAKNAEQRQLLVALIPSLAYFSPTINQFIQDKTEDIAVNFMENEQEGAFLKNARPLLKRLKKEHQTEWSLYQQAQKDAANASVKINTFAKLKRLTEQKQAQAIDSIHHDWLLYQREMDLARDYVEPLANQAYSAFKTQQKRYQRSSCKSECRTSINRAWTIEMEKAADLSFPQDMKWFYKTMFNVKDTFRLRLKRGREARIMQHFGVTEDIEYEDFIKTPKQQKKGVANLQKEGINVPNNWIVEDVLTLQQAIKQKYSQAATAAWKNYEQKSRFDLQNKQLDKIAFANTASIKDSQRKALGRFYYPSFQIYHSERQVYNVWKKSLSNISFIRMLTGAATEATFSPGGTFYELGIDAVKFSVVPPISIILSMLAILALVFKYLYYLWSKKVHRGIISLLTLAALSLIVIPIINAVNGPNSYTKMMYSFAENTTEINQVEKVFTTLFGSILDVESLLYEQRYHFPIYPLYSGFDQLLNPSNNQVNTYSGYLQDFALRQYDDQFNHLFTHLPERLGFGASMAPYDFNLTVYKRDQKLGLYMGLHQTKGHITHVTIPNIFTHNDIGFLLNQKIFFQPNYANLLLEYAHNARDPEYWLNLSTGKAGKENLLSVMERQLVFLLNNNQHNYGKLIQQSLQQGYQNLLLIQRSTGSSYDCYQLPTLNIHHLVNNLSSGQMPQANKFKCKGGLL